MSKSKRKLKRVALPGQPGAKNEISQDETLAEPSDQDEDNLAEDGLAPAAESVATESIASPPSRSDVPNPNRDYEEPSFIAKLGGAKKPEYKYGYVDPNEPHEFKRAMWIHLIRYPMSLILLLLNVALVMSFLERLPKHQLMDPFKELFFFGVVGFIDVFLFIPIVFEVNRIATDATGLKLTTLYWKVRLSWDQLIAFEQPRFLKFAMLRTKRSFYLLNKYDLKPTYFELAEIISAKMTKPIEDREA